MADKYTIEDIEREWNRVDNQTGKPIALDRHYARQTFANLDDSTWQAIENTVQPIIQTLKDPVGAAESLFDFAESMTYLTFVPGTQTEKEEIAKGFVDYYKERLGGIENIKKTFRDDPVGFVLDLSLVGSLGSTVLKQSGKQLGRSLNPNTKPSESRKNAQKIFTKSGDALQSASDFINPFIQTARLASTIPSFARATTTSALGALTQKLYEERIKERNVGIDKLKPKEWYEVKDGELLPKTINMDEVLDVWADIKYNPNRNKALSRKDKITGEIIPSPILNNPAVKQIDTLLAQTAKRAGLQDWQNISQLRNTVSDVFKVSEANIPGAEFGPINSAVSDLNKALKSQIENINPKYAEFKAAQAKKIDFQKRAEQELGIEPNLQLKTDRQVYDKLKSRIGREESDLDFKTLREVDPSDRIRSTILGGTFTDDIPVIKGATGSIQRQVMSPIGRLSLALSVPERGARLLATAGRARNYPYALFRRGVGRGLLGVGVVGREMERQEGDEEYQSLLNYRL